MKVIGEAGDAQAALAKLVPKDAHVVLEDDSIGKHDQLLTYR